MGTIDWNSLLSKAGAAYDDVRKRAILAGMPPLLRYYASDKERESMPISKRAFLSTFADQNMSPITEIDLSSDEQDALYSLIQSDPTAEKNVKTNRRQAFKYKDYPRRDRILNALNSMGTGMPREVQNNPDFLHFLGQFNYRVNPTDSSITVEDVYDFNPSKSPIREMPASAKEIKNRSIPQIERDAIHDFFASALTGNMYNAARQYAQLALPSYGGAGRQVNIELESPKSKKAKAKTRSKIEQERRAGNQVYYPYGANEYL